MSKSEFASAVRENFAFLIECYNYQEKNADDYTIEYSNNTMIIKVEGVHWGLNSRVALGTTFGSFENFDLFDVIRSIANIRFKLIPKLCQIDQLPVLASLLKTYGEPVLKGDASCFSKVQEIVNARPRFYSPAGGK